MHLIRSLCRAAFAVASALTITAVARADIAFTPLGDLPGGSVNSTASAISADGTTIVGKSASANGNAEAFRWTAATGIVGLGALSGGDFYSEARSVSADGAVVVGLGTAASGFNRAWRWTAAGGLTALPDLAGGIENGGAVGVSADGLVVAGNGTNSANRFEATLWSGSAAPVGLGFFTGGTLSEAMGFSGNGQVVVGKATRATGFTAAFRWSSAGGMQDLGYLPGGDSSYATAASNDGAVVVGRSFVANFGRRAFRWTAATGLVDLGVLGPTGNTSEALACSADGSVVVGFADGAAFGDTAFIWDAANGIRSLKALVQGAGQARRWTQFTMATGVSADGKKITGYGTNSQGQTEAFLINLDAPPPPPPPAPTAGLVWTENRPQTRPSFGNAVLRLGYDNGVALADIATQTEAPGTWGQVEYADGRILVASAAAAGTGTRVHDARYAPILVTNIQAYDLDATPGFVWLATGSGRTLQRTFPTTFSTVATAASGDRLYQNSINANVGLSTEALQVVGDQVYFSSQTSTPPGFYRVSVLASSFDAAVPVFTQTGLAILDFEVVGDHIYFGDTAANAIRRVNLDGTGLVTLVANAMFPNSIEVTDDAIYWTEMNTKLIRRSALDGSNVTTLYELDNTPRGVAVVPLSLITGPAPQAVAMSGISTNFSGAINVPQTLTLTTSSGLPALLDVVSGPATAVGNQVTFTGTGTVVLRAVQPGNDAYLPAEHRLTINARPRQAQSITFNPVTSVVYSGAPTPLTLSATASSGLAVTFSVVSGPATRDAATQVISVTGPGEVVIRASQTGNTTFASVFVDRTITVTDPAAPRTQRLTFNPPLAIVAGSAPLTLAATADSGLTPSYELVSMHPAGVATLSGARLTPVAAGFVTVRAVQAGGTRSGATYLAADPVELIIAVQPTGVRETQLHGAWAADGADFAVVFAPDGSYYQAEWSEADEAGQPGIEVGDYTWNLSGSVLSAEASFDQNGEWGLSHPQGVMQVVVVGDTLYGHDGADYFTLRRSNSTATPLVGAWRVPLTGGEAVVVFQADGSYLHLETRAADADGEPGFEIGDYVWTAATGAITATTSLDQNGEWGLSHPSGALAFVVTGNTLSVREGGAVVATGARIGSSAATATLKSQRITFAKPASRAFGTAPVKLTVTATSGLPVALEVISGPGELGEDNRTVTLTGAGEIRLRATQDGDATFSAAEPIVQSLMVTLKPQRLTFVQPAPVTYGVEPFELSATSDAELPVVFELVSSTPAGIATLDVATGVLTVRGAGKVTVRAKQAGDDDHAAATPVQRVLEIRKKPLLVTGVATPASRLVGLDNPPLSLGYDGFVGDDDVSDLDQRPVPKVSAVKGSAAGTYPITFTGGRDNDYVFTAGTPAGALTVIGFGGTYEALIVDDDSQQPVGRLSLTLPTSALTYTGSLRLARELKDVTVTSVVKSAGAGTTPFAAALEGEGVTAVWTRTATVGDALRLEMALAHDGTLSGTLERNGEPFGTLAFGRLVRVFASGAVADWEGVHTLALHSAYAATDAVTSDSPQGSGHAVGTVARTTGVMALTGKLGDGQLLTASLKPRVRVLEDGPAEVDYLLWALPYGARAESFVAGRLELERTAEPTRFGAARRRSAPETTLLWKKAGATADKGYRAGFGPLVVSADLDPWLAPTAARAARGTTLAVQAVTLPQRLGLAATSTESPAIGISHDEEAIYLGQLQAELPFAATMSALVAPKPTTALAGLQPSANRTKWKLTALNVANGSFAGTFTLSDFATSTASKATLRTVSFSGTLRQAPATEGGELVGTGHYLLNALPGAASTEQLSGEIRLFAAEPPALP